MASPKQKLERAAEELVEAKQRLKAAQEQFDALYRQVVSGARSKKTSGNNTLAEAASRTARTIEIVSEISATNRILDVLETDANKGWGYPEIEKILPDIPKNSIRALLYKLKKDGKAIKAGRGLWRSTQPVLVKAANGK